MDFIQKKKNKTTTTKKTYPAEVRKMDTFVGEKVRIATWKGIGKKF